MEGGQRGEREGEGGDGRRSLSIPVAEEEPAILEGGKAADSFVRQLHIESCIYNLNLMSLPLSCSTSPTAIDWKRWPPTTVDGWHCIEHFTGGRMSRGQRE